MVLTSADLGGFRTSLIYTQEGKGEGRKGPHTELGPKVQGEESVKKQLQEPGSLEGPGLLLLSHLDPAPSHPAWSPASNKHAECTEVPALRRVG